MVGQKTHARCDSHRFYSAAHCRKTANTHSQKMTRLMYTSIACTPDTRANTHVHTCHFTAHGTACSICQQTCTYVTPTHAQTRTHTCVDASYPTVILGYTAQIICSKWCKCTHEHWSHTCRLLTLLHACTHKRTYTN